MQRAQPMKLVFPFLASVLLLACSVDDSDTTPQRSLVVAVTPGQSKEALLARHTPLMRYLEAATGLDIELVIPLDYSDLLNQFASGSIDLAWFGGLTFTQAEARSEAVPLAFRDVDLEFTSCYLVGKDEPRSSVREFEGSSFSFGPNLSTSGHLMPRYFLEREGIYPEQFFSSTRHSSAHDQTIDWVSDGSVELGVANCLLVQSLFDSGSLGRDEVRIIETTPPYSDYIWATKASIPYGIRMNLLNALLSLDASNPEHLEILRSQGANAYLPAASDNFITVRAAARRVGLLDEDGRN